MDYSLAEQIVLALSETTIEMYHAARDRPRTFWGLWVVSFLAAAWLLLRPGAKRARS